MVPKFQVSKLYQVKHRYGMNRSYDRVFPAFSLADQIDSNKTLSWHCKCEVFWPFGVDTLVEAHAHQLPLLHRPIEQRLHGAMRTKGLCDAPPSPHACVQLHRPEPANVVRVMEHEAHGGPLLVHAHRKACQHNLLEDHPVGVGPAQRPGRCKLRRPSCGILLERQQRQGGVGDGRVAGGHGRLPGPQPPLHFVLVPRCVGAEHGAGHKGAQTCHHEQLLLIRQGLAVARGLHHAEVDN
mmetsp:Transcript_12577/g.22253  ORF Transcript_12577/g.22253 Transcript_12577/m.22253 type:complete len:239 (+) Transcript_12577:65-781(+)